MFSPNLHYWRSLYLLVFGLWREGVNLLAPLLVTGNCYNMSWYVVVASHLTWLFTVLRHSFESQRHTVLFNCSALVYFHWLTTISHRVLRKMFLQWIMGHWKTPMLLCTRPLWKIFHCHFDGRNGQRLKTKVLRKKL